MTNQLKSKNDISWAHNVNTTFTSSEALAANADFFRDSLEFCKFSKILASPRLLTKFSCALHAPAERRTAQRGCIGPFRSQNKTI